jgi:hypothetical protein
MFGTVLVRVGTILVYGKYGNRKHGLLHLHMRSNNIRKCDALVSAMPAVIAEQRYYACSDAVNRASDFRFSHGATQVWKLSTAVQEVAENGYR